ncbi:VOC family protein [Nocardia veterana]|uniref:VOC domain-containing protein n=1 Tax=Nocardia veterana TaxID=132249 RepID=A0A7X6RHD9_9NOCA|nr:VOC family protein [Nocardia veterana]NKY85508.1 hypothetical protein [Nocardia veterana]
MTDPLDALRAPAEPVHPDPAFAERLRERLVDAVVHAAAGRSATDRTARESDVPTPRGAIMTEADTRGSAAEPATSYPALTPYIVVDDARRALDWYVTVFGATRRGEPIVNADGTIGHAELGLGNAVLMVSERSELWPDVPVAPPAGPTHSHSLHLQVGEVDELTRRAAAAGAAVERQPRDQPYGRGSVIVDPFGHRWILLVAPHETR